MYSLDGEIVPHKHGFHYATSTKALKSWYRNNYLDNEVYIVQAGTVNINAGHGRAVTDKIIFLKDINWDIVEQMEQENKIPF